MPTYEYACSSCAHEWEHEQSIKEDPLKECPKCHGQTARRQISRGAGFILKGGGWYSDLYASSSNSKPAGQTKSSETKVESKSETKTESKSETKASSSDSGGGASAKGSSTSSAVA